MSSQRSVIYLSFLKGRNAADPSKNSEDIRQGGLKQKHSANVSRTEIGSSKPARWSPNVGTPKAKSRRLLCEQSLDSKGFQVKTGVSYVTRYRIKT